MAKVEVVNADGVVMDQEELDFAYTREGRRTVGKEYPDPRPLEAPIGFVPSKPIHEQVRDLVAVELSRRAEADGEETFEEADDFEVGDDYDPTEIYEADFEPTDPWPASRAVRALEAQIAEYHAQSRIEALQAELDSLRAGTGHGGLGPQPPSPPAEPAPKAPAEPAPK